MISYNVFSNNGTGGPINYSTVVATVAATTWQAPALAVGSDWSYGVRAVDSTSGLSERNIDCQVRIRPNAAGIDLGTLPPSPTITGTTPLAGGKLRVDWAWLAPAGRMATSFAIYVSTTGTIDPAATPALTIPGGRPGNYGATLSGLVAGQAVTVGVFATIGVANSLVAAANFTPSASGPLPVGSLVATAVATPRH